MADPKPEPKPKTAKYTVADRRSLYVDGKHHNAGTEVDLDVEEAKGLMQGGFLVNPDAVPLFVAEGPVIKRVDG